MSELLNLSNVSSGYGKATVLRDISIYVNEAETICLLGANGAGKSTLVKTIAGIIKPTCGKIMFGSEEITGRAPEEIVKKGISLVSQGRTAFPFMTVQENLDMGAYSVRNRLQLSESMEMAFKLFPILHQRKNQRAGTMSGGEQKMLEIARALMTRPKLLILDEPSLGLAPKVLDTIFEKVKGLQEAGTSVLLVEQVAQRALEVSQRGYVLEIGRITLEGGSNELVDSEVIKKRYLGG